MLVKGIIDKKVDNYTYKVRIPFLDKIESDSNPTLSEDLSEAPMCTIAGVHSVYESGDVVYIDFENDDLSDPVILGKLDREADLGSYNNIETATLQADITANLPEQTYIGSVQPNEIVALKGIHNNIQQQLDAISSSTSSILVGDSKTDINSLGENGQGTPGNYGTGLKGILQQWFYEMPSNSIRFFYVTFSGTWSPFRAGNATLIQMTKGATSGSAVFYGKDKSDNTESKLAVIGCINNQWYDFEDIISDVGGTINGRLISHYDDTNASINGGGAFEIAHSTANRESMYIARRADTENTIGFGIGTGGVNRGIYDYKLAKWIVQVNNSAGYFKGNADTATTLSQTLAADKGGTGETTLNAAANSLINSLTTGDSAPRDDDYYVSQVVGGGTTSTTYHRRPMVRLWNYIQSKLVTDGGTTRIWTLSAGTPIPENSDLNSYSTEGNYTCNLINTAKTLFNGPYGSPTTSGGTTTYTDLTAFIMKVVNSTSASTYRRQELFEYGGFKHWVRYSSNSGSSWGAWNLYTFKSGNSAVGSSTKPVYITAGGVATATDIDLGWKDITTQNFSYTLSSNKSESADATTSTIFNISDYNTSSYSEVRAVVTVSNITKQDYSTSTPGTGKMSVKIGYSTSTSNSYVADDQTGTFTTCKFTSASASSYTGPNFYNSSGMQFRVLFVYVTGPLGKDSVISGTVKLQGRNV